MDYATLLGFPIEVIFLIVICFTVVELVKLWTNRKSKNEDLDS